jgi:hypothetical protein
MKKHLNNRPMPKVLAVLIAFLFIISLSSCGGGAKQADTDKTADGKTLNEAFKAVTNYPIPTSFEVVKMLNKAGASYIISLNNPVENVDKYFTEKSKALNLGVYGANLSYASTYQMKQETMNYLNVSKKLIDDLQISTAFNMQFAQRVEQNIDNKDSLIHIISNSFYDTYQFLTNQGKDNLSLLVMAGSWIEGVYITSQIAIISKDNSDFLKILADQYEPLNTLLDLMEPASSDEAISEVANMLKPLSEVYKEFTGETITNDQFETINNLISKIRSQIING